MTKKTQAAKFLGRLGGLKGGPARAKALTPKQRSAIARKGGKARAKARAETQWGGEVVPGHLISWFLK